MKKPLRERHMFLPKIDYTDLPRRNVLHDDCINAEGANLSFDHVPQIEIPLRIPPVMHGDLSPHLHTEECNLIIKQLQECHKTNSISKFWGASNDIDRLMVRCLRKEREDRRARNAELARAKQARIKSQLADQQPS